jgi:hemimethylated DNA binding protein
MTPDTHPQVTEFVIGDYVRTTDHNFRGRVYKLHPDGCPESELWLRRQSIPVREHKDEPWISVLVNGGGAVAVPTARAFLIEPFEPFTHSGIGDPFGEAQDG